MIREAGRYGLSAGATGEWFDIRNSSGLIPKTRSVATAMSRFPIILIAACIALGCAQKRENIVHVIAERAPGLKKNARVQYRGVDVGLVKQVYFTPGGVRIDLLIERDDAPIRAQDTVRIVSVGAFGSQVVDIQPGVQTAPLIRRGTTLPRVQPESTVSMPVSMWRSMVRMLGFAAETTVADSAAGAVADSAAAKSAKQR
jgi:ABC-type transporter Mla subunit MlaD